MALLKLHINVMDFHLDDDDRLEAKIQANIMKYLKIVPCSNFVKIAQGAWSQNGVSDIVGCYRGIFVAIEVKRRHTKLTAKQTMFLNAVILSGGFSAIARSTADVEKILSVVDGEIE